MTLIWLGVGIIFAAYFYYILRNREIATEAVINYCHLSEVMLLDQHVVFWKIRLERSNKGNLIATVYYRFEFTATGEARLKGSIKMIGNRAAQIVLQPYPTESSEAINIDGENKNFISRAQPRDADRIIDTDDNLPKN